MNAFLTETIGVMTNNRRALLRAMAIHIFGGDPGVLYERLKAATTPDECDEIFAAWAEEARAEVPK